MIIVDLKPIITLLKEEVFSNIEISFIKDMLSILLYRSQDPSINRYFFKIYLQDTLELAGISDLDILRICDMLEYLIDERFYLVNINNYTSLSLVKWIDSTSVMLGNMEKYNEIGRLIKKSNISISPRYVANNTFVKLQPTGYIGRRY